jgi:hypothetical protein
MNTSAVEVRIHGQGTVAGGQPHRDESARAACEACGNVTDAVVSTGPNGSRPFLCKSCLRERLEQITLALWMFRDQGQKGLPWGKISG